MTKLVFAPPRSPDGAQLALEAISKKKFWNLYTPAQRVNFRGYAGTVALDPDQGRAVFNTPSRRGILRRLFDKVFRGISMDGKVVLSRSKYERIHQLEGLFSRAIDAIRQEAACPATFAQDGLEALAKTRKEAEADYERAFKCDQDPAGQLKALLAKLNAPVRPSSADEWGEIVKTLREPKVAKRFWSDVAAIRTVLSRCPHLTGFNSLLGNRQDRDGLGLLAADSTCRMRVAELISAQLSEASPPPQESGRQPVSADVVGELFKRIPEGARHAVACAVVCKLEDIGELGRFIQKYGPEDSFAWQGLLEDKRTNKHVTGLLDRALVGARNFTAGWKILRPFLVPYQHQSYCGYSLPTKLSDVLLDMLFAKLRRYDEIAQGHGDSGPVVIQLHPQVYSHHLTKALRENPEVQEGVKASIRRATARLMMLKGKLDSEASHIVHAVVEAARRVDTMQTTEPGASADEQTLTIQLPARPELAARPDREEAMRNELKAFGQGIFALLTARHYVRADWATAIWVGAYSPCAAAMGLVRPEDVNATTDPPAIEAILTNFRDYESELKPLLLCLS